MAKIGITQIIMIAVAVMVVAVIFPQAVGLIANSGNVIVNATSGETLSDVADSSVVTLLDTLVPIIAIIAVILLFLAPVAVKARRD